MSSSRVGASSSTTPSRPGNQRDPFNKAPRRPLPKISDGISAPVFSHTGAMLFQQRHNKKGGPKDRLVLDRLSNSLVAIDLLAALMALLRFKRQGGDGAGFQTAQ